MYKQLFLIAVTGMLVATVLSACGFQLRGQNKLPSELKMVYIESSQPYHSLVTSLKNRLQASAIQVAEQPQQAQLTVVIEPQELTHQVTSASASNEVRNYWLTYPVTFTVLDRHGKVIIAQETLTVGRHYVANQDQIRSDNQEMQLIKQQMERELISLLFNRLRSEQVTRLLQAQ